MRITGGERRGIRLASFKGERIRPTSDRVREAIFDLLGQYTIGLRVLDLFAGTGALGIEALSRGARRVVFVDNSPESLKLIRRNLAMCGYESVSTLLKKDLTRGLPAVGDLGHEGVDLVFADPPYKKGYLLPVLSELSASFFLSSRATIVAEAGKEEHLPDTVGTLSLAKTRVYGDTKISIYTYGGHET
ncbi:MAG: 16S rRNA (guanine(966)-N(2))-methyltransferase RsmD [Deltaproteobacteria bacterium HGW-Deltaproteobacteria-15]|jgi:16S rRNA (guanine966-N2)-methyltransferase|nr:MAG: 16S rRNA (guanine(966)-N(2))-methyltransferase RsmD [Deltaproteobacteria bacterium HGW-Deltaproteobacteria-15]